MSATFTKRIDSGIRDLWDRYQDGSWETRTGGGLLGKFADAPSGDVTYNLSLRFTGITIPQGATIISAKITFTSVSGVTSQVLNYRITGVDEDNAGEFGTSPIDDARTRTHTTAYASWSPTLTLSIGSTYDTADFTSVIQEIVDRGGWSSGNALAIYIYDNATSTGNVVSQENYEDDSNKAPLLTIEYDDGGSPSPSPSPSLSISRSPSLSPSLSISATPSLSVSRSPSPSPMPTEQLCLKIAKRNVNVLTNSDVQNLVFDSTKGSLKYFTINTVDVTVKSNSTDLDIAAKETITHNLGYYPDAEVYMKTPSGDYIRCPAVMAGASATFKGDFQIKENTIDFYAENSGYPTFSSNQTYTFIYFIFKNNLHL